MITRLFKYASGLCLAIACLSACNLKDVGLRGFDIDKKDIAVGPEGGTEFVKVASESEWVAMASEPWVMVSPANGFGNTVCHVEIDSSLVNDARTASIRFAPEGQSPVIVKVTQMGFSKQILFEKDELEIESSARRDKRFCKFKVTTNVAFKMNVDYGDGTVKWLAPEDVDMSGLDRGARPRTIEVRLDWNMNTEPAERTAKIDFVPASAGETLAQPAVLTIRQKAAPRIEDNRKGDSLAIAIIADKLEVALEQTDENLKYWKNVKLWERSDKDLPCPEAAGRVREVSFVLMNTKESVPQEVRYLKYVETLDFYSNVNTMLLNIDLGPELCSLEHLKNLRVGAYGLVSLPEEFKNLGKTLEVLDLSSNNFATIPPILTPENFPKLKELSLVACRRWSTKDLRINDPSLTNGLGLHMNTETDNGLRRLLLWENLEYLGLSYNYIEGHLPDFTVGQEGVVAWSQADVDEFGEDGAIQYLADQGIPRILPKAKQISLNLNFFTGDLPKWLLYHPRLLDMYPEVLIFNQQENGFDSNGNNVRFDNEPDNFEYYFEAFPKLRSKYELKEEQD